jgi:2-amino-4-hydroxy-6-hydroxymethyldihydropteridine diphosphokinase
MAPSRDLAVSEIPVVLGLGSNRAYAPDKSRRIQEPLSILQEAVSALGEILGGLRLASVYRTSPLGVEDQPPFLNTAVTGQYGGEPEELLAAVQAIEARFGRDRRRERRWGERSLDIDILLFGDRVVKEASLLEIPHPRLRERRFALVPLLELLPETREPGTGFPYRSICDALPPQGVERLGYLLPPD